MKKKKQSSTQGNSGSKFLVDPSGSDGRFGGNRQTQDIRKKGVRNRIVGKREGQKTDTSIGSTSGRAQGRLKG